MLLDTSQLLIRADGGPQIGTGHVMRMMALAQAYRRRGGRVAMVVGELPRVLMRRLESEKIQVYPIQNASADLADAIETCEIAAVVRPDWIVLDGYKFDDSYQAKILDSGARILVMDDFGHATHVHADWVVNQNIVGNTYQEKVASKPRYLSGVRYALLRNEFLATAARRIPATAKRILVTFGGADPDNWTIRTLQILSDMNLRKLVVDCVVGSCYGAFAELEQLRKYANLTLRIHKNVDRMSSLMMRADLAISAAGTTCYELARCGVPTITMPIADNQIAVARTLHEHGAMVCADPNFPESVDRCDSLRRWIRKLIHDSAQRRQLARVAGQLVDGRGAIRIVDQLAAAEVHLRLATEQDAELLWQWRNDPEVRAVSFSTTSISLANHQAWLAGQLVSENSHVWVAENRDGTCMGSVRFQSAADSHRATISVIVAPALRGRGVGSAMLRACVDKLFTETDAQEVLAQVKSGNVASERAFLNAGFHCIDPVVIHGVMATQYLISRGSPPVSHPRQRVA